MIKNRLYSLENLSRYRTELMGIAMIFIIIFHTSVDVDDIFILRSLKNIGDIGVDIFLFLSGLGLYFSYNKDNNKKRFYKNRFLRIIPMYLIIALVWYTSYYIVFGGSIKNTILDILTLGFWTRGNMCYWYISAIVLLYTITPYYIDILKKNPKIITILISIFIIGIIFFIRFTQLNNLYGYLLVFLARVPIFIIGIYVGILVYEKFKVTYKDLFLLVLVSIIALVISILVVNPEVLYIPFILKYIAYIPITVFLCILICEILIRCNKFNILRIFGTYSLEVYLLHEKILWIISIVSSKIIILNDRNITINILAIILSIQIAYSYNKFIKGLIHKYNTMKIN